MKTTTKERPILFSGAMVRALLDGSKTQTRRVCKSQPYSNGFHFDGHEILCHNDYLPPSAMLMDYRDSGQTYTTSNMEGWEFCCPYGQPGDRLWVRETWLEDPEDDGTWHYTQYMGCKGSPLSEIPRKFQKPEHCLYREGWTGHDLIWRPSIHMPRWASRILLEITGVRVERLQDISQDDAQAEGITDGGCLNCGESEAKCACSFPMPDYRDSYCHLWEQINGAGSWDANPWVWVVEFTRVIP